MGVRTAGTRLWRWRVPPALVALLVLAVVPLTARADCPPRSGCVSDDAVRACDRDQSALVEVRLQLASANQRAVDALQGAERLNLTVGQQSRIILDLRRELAVERDRWPWSTWLLIGSAATLLVEAVVVGLVLWAD